MCTASFTTAKKKKDLLDDANLRTIDTDLSVVGSEVFMMPSS